MTESFKNLTMNEKIRIVTQEPLDVALDGVEYFLLNSHSLLFGLILGRLKEGICNNIPGYEDLLIYFIRNADLGLIRDKFAFLTTFMPLGVMNVFLKRFYDDESYDISQMGIFFTYYLTMDISVKDKLIFLEKFLSFSVYDREIIELLWTIVPESTSILIKTILLDHGTLPVDLPMLETLKKSIGEDITEELKNALTYLSRNYSSLYMADILMSRMKIEKHVFLNRSEFTDEFLMERILDENTIESFAILLVDAVLKNVDYIKVIATKTSSIVMCQVAFNKVIKQVGVNNLSYDFIWGVIMRTDKMEVIDMINKTNHKVELATDKLCQTDSLWTHTMDSLIDIVVDYGGDDDLQNLSLRYFTEIKRLMRKKGSIIRYEAQLWGITCRLISFMKFNSGTLTSSGQNAFKTYIDRHISYIGYSKGGNTLWLLMPYIDDMEWVGDLFEDHFENILFQYTELQVCDYNSLEMEVARDYSLDDLYRQLDSATKKRILALNADNDQVKQYILSLEV